VLISDHWWLGLQNTVACRLASISVLTTSRRRYGWSVLRARLNILRLTVEGLAYELWGYFRSSLLLSAFSSAECRRQVWLTGMTPRRGYVRPIQAPAMRRGIWQTTVSSSLTSVCADSLRDDVCCSTITQHLWRSVFRPWNSLPSKLQQCDSLGEFRRSLTTHLFGDHGALWHFREECRLEIILPLLHDGAVWLVTFLPSTFS